MPTATFYRLPEEKQNRILNIAAGEFASHPYDAASISEIVRQAEIAKGSFYQYFEDKKELYRALIEIGTETKLNLINDLPAPDPNSDFFDFLKRQFLGTAIFNIRYPDLARVLNRAFVEEVPFPEMTEELRRRGTTQFFQQLIGQGIAHGDIAVWVDPETAAFLLETVFYQFGQHLSKRLGLLETTNPNKNFIADEQVNQILNNLMDLLEAGMKREPTQRDEYFTKG